VNVLIYSGSVGSGMLLGWLVAKLWKRCTPRETHRQFWVSLVDITKCMLAVDELQLLLSLYRRLALDVGGYLLRNIGGLVVACLPVVVFSVFVAPLVLELWDRTADRVVLYPQAAVDELTAVERSEMLATLGISAIELDQQPTNVVGRTAVCWTQTSCAFFRLLAFEVIETPAAILHDAPYLVVRAQHGDVNFLWPYLNDLEFAFVCAFMVTTIGSLLLGRRAAT
jgi:hypothetical protein